MEWKVIVAAQSARWRQSLVPVDTMTKLARCKAKLRFSVDDEPNGTALVEPHANQPLPFSACGPLRCCLPKRYISRDRSPARRGLTEVFHKSRYESMTPGIGCACISGRLCANIRMFSASCPVFIFALMMQSGIGGARRLVATPTNEDDQRVLGV